MVKRLLYILGFLSLFFTPTQVIKSETIPVSGWMYVTTEDIILDIIFPTIDKRVIQMYGQDTLFSWQWKRIVDIKYNDNHTYDISVIIEIPSNNFNVHKEDLVKVRIAPSCDSEKLNKLKCKHEFKNEILEYKHLNP